MRLSSLLLLTSAVAASVAESRAQGLILALEPPTAGAPAQVRTYGNHNGPVKVRFWVKGRDGSQTELPALTAQLPLANQPLEGPVVPAGTGGGSLYAEIYDSATGEKLSKDAAPIKF